MVYISNYKPLYGMYHNYPFCNANEPFYKVLENGILTETLQKYSFALQMYNYGTNHLDQLKDYSEHSK